MRDPFNYEEIERSISIEGVKDRVKTWIPAEFIKAKKLGLNVLGKFAIMEDLHNPGKYKIVWTIQKRRNMTLKERINEELNRRNL